MSQLIYLLKNFRKSSLFALGFSQSLVSLSWAVALLPLSWIGFPGITGNALFLIVLFLVASVGGISFVLFELFFLACRKYKSELVRFLVFIFVVFLTELTKSILLCFLFVGTGTSFAFHWTILSIGYFVAFNPLVAWASIYHIYGLSFCFACIFYLGCLFIRYKIKAFFILLTLLILCTSMLFIINKPQPFVPEIPIIVYPEGIIPLDKDDHKSNYLYITGGSEVTTVGSKKFNVSNFFLNGVKVKVIQKEFLMPFGEYMPNLFKPLASLFLNKKNTEKNYDYWEYMRFGYLEGGNDSRVFNLNNKTKVSTLLCSEILSSTVLYALKKEKPSIVYLQGSYLHFNKSNFFFFFLERWRAAAEFYVGANIMIIKAD